MSLRVAVVAILHLSASALAAQARLTGVVRDSAGTPVAGAEVTVQDMARKATTDRRGGYQLPGIKTGTIKVLVRRIGYASYDATLVLAEGDSRLDVVLVAIPRELDTLATREQQLWREYPMLREFEENRKVGLGQFVTREQLAKIQGAFLGQVFDQMRGILVVRSQTVQSHTWLANRYIPDWGCFQLEDRLSSEVITPKGADCGKCYPDVYLNSTRIAADRVAPNISQFSPDQLQAIEVYLGAAETPARYSSAKNGCGVIVFHQRVPDLKPRVIARREDEPTRSRLFATASISAGQPGAACPDCETGSAIDGSLGYTIRDRWVISGRYLKWQAGSAQTMTMRQALLEWYPNPDPGRFKWFVNGGAGTMSVGLLSKHGLDYTDEYHSTSLPSVVAGTGVDIALVRRFVLTPFLSHTRTVGGHASQTHCINTVPNSGPITTSCYRVNDQPRVFNLTQLGTRIGWR
jgi:hypothetical protein